jgi:hypothetical protein
MLPGQRILLVVAALVVLGGLVVGALDLSSDPARTAAHTAASREQAAEAATPSRPAPATRAATPARRLASLVVPEAPTAARLPGGRLVPIRPVSTRADRTLDVPENITTAGWWRGGARMGDPFGSMLVAAHIDSRTQGLGPFSELLEVRPGQRVGVTSRHLQQQFEIRSRRLVPQGSLAHQRWLFAPTGSARLTLVTCAPPYDPGRGGYQNLAVVTATPLTEPVRRSR